VARVGSTAVRAARVASIRAARVASIRVASKVVRAASKAAAGSRSQVSRAKSRGRVVSKSLGKVSRASAKATAFRQESPALSGDFFGRQGSLWIVLGEAHSGDHHIASNGGQRAR
jgi:hypothetical protein